MHELNIVRSVLISVNSNPAVRKKIEEGWKIKKITIVNGELSTVSNKELINAFRKLCDYNITIEEERAVVDCECGYKGSANIIERKHAIVVWSCPLCERLYPTVIAGESIRIKKIILAETDR